MNFLTPCKSKRWTSNRPLPFLLLFVLAGDPPHAGYGPGDGPSALPVAPSLASSSWTTTERQGNEGLLVHNVRARVSRSDLHVLPTYKGCSLSFPR